MNQRNSEPSSLFAAVGLSLGAAIGLGMSRFAYALILPAMKQNLGLDYVAAGALNTANAVGYVLGAISAYIMLFRFQSSVLFSFGLIVTVVTLFLTGLVDHLGWLLGVRVINGITAAWTMICGATIVAARYSASVSLRKIATGIFFSGAGLGIILSGWMVNPIIAYLGTSSWNNAWFALGISSLILSIWPLIEAQCISGSANTSTKQPLDLGGLGGSMFAYFLFACGYIVYMTFIFAWKKDIGLNWVQGSIVWTILGGAVAASPFVWRKALDLWSPLSTLSACCAVSFIGTVIPIIFPSIIGILTSAFFFGLGMFIAPSAMAILVQKTMAPQLWSRGVTLFTAIFSIGQGIGPVLAGYLADFQGLQSSIMLGAVLLAAASVTGLLARKHTKARLEKIVIA